MHLALLQLGLELLVEPFLLINLALHEWFFLLGWLFNFDKLILDRVNLNPNLFTYLVLHHELLALSRQLLLQTDSFLSFLLDERFLDKYLVAQLYLSVLGERLPRLE